LSRPTTTLHGGDSARLLGTPSLSACASADDVARLVRAAAAIVEVGRWIELGGWDRARLDLGTAAFAEAFDAAASRHPTCLWSADFRRARLNTHAARFAHVAVSTLDFPETDSVRRVLPRWTLEVWKDRLGLLADALTARGVRVVRDLDGAAAEGWRALDDEGLLMLDRVETVFPASELRRRVREGERTGKGSERVALAGVVFDLDRAAWSRDRTLEELTLARDAGIRVLFLATDDAARRFAAEAVAATAPHPPGLSPEIVSGG
jgi:predicted amidohydrolase YtcJ